jgi:hypothetical protein
MAQSQLTYDNKTNPIDVIDRSQQATAEDFNEIKSVVNANATDADDRITQNESDIASNTSSISNKVSESDVNSSRGTLVYSARILWLDSVITKTEFINDKDGSTFISSISEVDSDKLGIYLSTSNTSWQTDLEIQATPNPQTAVSVCRVPHFFYEAATYISMHLIDSGGASNDDAGFWIRIYDWS